MVSVETGTVGLRVSHEARRSFVVLSSVSGVLRAELDSGEAENGSAWESCRARGLRRLQRGMCNCPALAKRGLERGTHCLILN